MHAQYAAHTGHIKFKLMGFYKHVLYSDWLAKYLAAFFNISRSSVTRFSSDLVRNSAALRLAASSAAWGFCCCWLPLTQRDKVLSAIPMRFETSMIE